MHDQPPHDVLRERRLPALPEVSIWLDCYDDIFSDFDSRPYSERALSDDFLKEVKKVVSEKPYGAGTLNLLVPAASRNQEHEATIVKNLHKYFRNSFRELSRVSGNRRRKGIIFTFAGTLLMLAGGYLFSLHSSQLYINVLLVIAEPAGWFLTWNGLDHIFFAPSHEKTNLSFLGRMSTAKISFRTY